MRLADIDRLAGLALPVLGESGVEILVQLAGWVVGDVEQCRLGNGTTDAEGRFTFEVEADIADKISSQRFTFDIVITDLNNQEVAAQAEAIANAVRTAFAG